MNTRAPRNLLPIDDVERAKVLSAARLKPSPAQFH